ncbi:MAG TPA: hypothetical protein VN920_05875 [Pyrinomonadaceae bacterium]|nr:hypothetical protein [Pyrinomonadaceae bacterium]
MVTLLFTSVFIIGILAVALYFWQKPSKSSDRTSLPPQPVPPRGLFSESVMTDSVSSSLVAASDNRESQRSLLRERARGADQSALEKAQALGDKEFYNEILNLLVAAVDSEASLLVLVSYVARNELPVNNHLAQAVLASWQKTPDRSSTTKTLHIAAMADDAELYRSAVEAVLKSWRAGQLVDVSPLELKALFDGEFWVLSSGTRNSGAGFVLKRTLANARRELGSAAGINQ